MIRISPVRVIGPQGEQLGVLPVEEALAAAQDRGLDLVEVAPTARPPVVKIMDYGKFKFEEAKAARARRSPPPRGGRLGAVRAWPGVHAGVCPNPPSPAPTLGR